MLVPTGTNDAIKEAVIHAVKARFDLVESDLAYRVTNSEMRAEKLEAKLTEVQTELKSVGSEVKKAETERKKDSDNIARILALMEEKGGLPKKENKASPSPARQRSASMEELNESKKAKQGLELLQHPD